MKLPKFQQVGTFLNANNIGEAILSMGGRKKTEDKNGNTNR